MAAGQNDGRRSNNRSSSGGRGGRSRGETDPQRVIVGVHPVREALRAGVKLDRVELVGDRHSSSVIDEIEKLARAANIEVRRVEREELDSRADGSVHQGVVAIGPPYRYAKLEDVLALATPEDPTFLIALDGVTDPHNLGSIARTAEAVGAHGLLVPSRRAVGVTATAEKSAAGALAYLPVVRVGNLVRTLDDLSQQGVWRLGLAADGSVPLATCNLLVESLVVIVGAEGRGLARLTADHCDQLVHLPMRGRVGSLNASVAAAVAMYEVRDARDGLSRDG